MVINIDNIFRNEKVIAVKGSVKGTKNPLKLFIFTNVIISSILPL